jgi:hypothetical protein
MATLGAGVESLPNPNGHRSVYPDPPTGPEAALGAYSPSSPKTTLNLGGQRSVSSRTSFPPLGTT